MNTFTRLMMPLLLLAVLIGCRDRGEQGEASDEHVESEPGVTYNASRGLYVPPETASFIGLTTTDVEERLVKSEFCFSAQVYRTTAVAQPASVRSMAPATTLASADVNPEDARILRQGQSVNAELEGANSVPGRITEIHPHNEKSGAHMDVTIAMEDKDAQLRPGSFVTVKVPIGGETKVVSVPRSALLRTAEGQFVYTVNGEHFVRTPVKVGIVNADYVEVPDGLYAGDKVVVNPVMALWMAELQSIRGGKACADGH